MRPVVIETTPFSFRMKILKNGFIPEPYLNLQELLAPFTTWYFDRRARRMLPGKKYRYYSMKDEKVYLPIYHLPAVLSYFDSHHILYQMVALELPAGKDVTIPMIGGFKPKNEKQAAAINYLNTKADALKGVALQTGVGKTVTTIRHLSHLGKRALIGVQGLTDQWENAIKEWTLLEDDDVFVIKGGPSVTKLLTRIDKSLDPKIIIYSIGTLRHWALDSPQYENFPSFDDIARLFNVGIRVVDEGHNNFYINYIMDLRIIIPRQVVLTATFDVSDPKVKAVFDSHYPRSIRFGEGEYKKYVNVTAYGYRSGYDDIPSYAYLTSDGYSHVSLEKWLLKRPKKLDWIYRTIYRPIIDSHYINLRKPGQKLLVLCEKVEMCEYLALKIREDHPELITNIYIGETADEIYEISDVIVSTTKSSGTAVDISNLRTVFHTSSIRSAPQNIQNIGRLRELKNPDPDEHPEFVYVYNKSLQKQIDHHHVRQSIFEPRARQYKDISIHD